MKTDIAIQSFYVGLILFGLCLIGILAKLGGFVIIVSHFLPGLLLGFVMVQSIKSNISSLQKVLFLFASTSIHIGCVFFVNVAHDHEVWTPVKLVFASSIGAMFLTLVHDWLFKKRITLIRTFLLPLFLGTAASLSSAISMYYLHQIGFQQELLEGFLWPGIFSIFPLWYSLFVWEIRKRWIAAATLACHNTGFEE